MKKVLKASLIAATALALGCALVACDGDDPGKKPQEPTKVTVTFDWDFTGPNIVNPADQVIDKGGLAVKPADEDVPDRVNRTFEGWHVGSKDGELFDFTKPVNADTDLVANWTINAGYYSVNYSLPEGATGNLPEEQIVASGSKIDLPPTTQFTKDGWTFYRWKGKTATANTYLINNNEYTVNADVVITPVFAKEYDYFDPDDYGYGGTKIQVYDDGQLAMDYGYGDGYEAPDPFTVDWYGNIEVSVDGGEGEIYTITYKTNDEDNTFAIADGLQTLDVVANDGFTSLYFDGFGNVELDGNKGTYEYDYGTTITLKFGESDGGDLTIVFVGNTNAVDYLTGTITIEETDYVFGAPEEEEPWEGTIPAKYYGAYEGEGTIFDTPTSLVITVTADGITVAIDGGAAEEAVIYDYEDADGVEAFTVKVDGFTYYVNKGTENEDGNVESITIRADGDVRGYVTCTRPSEGSDEE